MDVVSAYRAKGYCDHLAAFGIFPTLVTHRWEPDAMGNWKFHDDEEVVIEKSDNCVTIRLPRKKNHRIRTGKITNLANYVRGDFEPELEASYRTFRKFLLNYVPAERFDALLVIFSPHFQMKLAYEMKKRFGLPYITDFRDLWDNQVITTSYRPDFRKRAIDSLIKFWWKRWIREAEFFTTTGLLWMSFLEKVTGKKGYVVRNGFELEFVPESDSPVSPPEFVITHFGRLYPSQDLGIFIDGYRLFFQKTGGNVRLEIIGSKPHHGIDGKELLAGLPQDSWSIIPYMGKKELLQYCKARTTVFWMPGFSEDNGQLPVKVYDYLMLKKNVLLVPNNSPDLEHVVAGSGAGVACNTPDEVCTRLQQWYESFRNLHAVPYHGNSEVIQRYARVHQVMYLADRIHAHIG